MSGARATGNRAAPRAPQPGPGRALLKRHAPLRRSPRRHLVTTALAACSGTVVEGDGGSSGDPTGGDPGNTTGGNPTGGDPGNTTGGNPTGGNPTPVAGPALANTRAQIDVLWEEYWEQHGGDSGSTSGSSGGTPLDPNDLFLRAADVGVSCGSPTVELDCGSHWQVTLVLPPALQQVGVYDLSSDALVQYSSMFETGPDDGPECWAGGGSLGAGTLEITAIDATHVDFVLTLDEAFDSDPSGTYSAPRCP
ncbi:MAG: hypothetical protein WKG00_36085 [Polyangiaceae bacterium]